MDDGAEHARQKPLARGTRATTRAPKPAAPGAANGAGTGGATGSARTDDGLRRRAGSGRSAANGAARTRPDDVLLPGASLIDDPLLPPVQEGTPIEIPRIVPAQFDEDEDLGTAPGVYAHNDLYTEPVPVVVPTDDYTSDLPRPPEFTDADGTGGLPSMFKPARPARSLRPVTVPRARRPRVRRVTRVLRTVDTWSVFKVALCFNLFLYAVCLTAGVLLWQVAQNTGTVDNVERFFESFGWQSFQLKGGIIYHNAWVGGLFLVVGFTGLAVLAATMFNLIADLVGGIRLTVLEEEVIAREERGHGWRWAAWRHGEAPAPSADGFGGDPSDVG